MANPKALSAKQKAAALELVKFKLKYIDDKPKGLQLYLYTDIFEKVFKGGINKESYKHGLAQLIKHFLASTYNLTSKQIKTMYWTEFKFLADLSQKPSVPPYVVRLLCQNFLDNLEGNSLWDIPGGKYSLPLEEFEDLKIQMREIYRATFNKKLSHSSITTKLPETHLKAILSKHFYNLDLRLLLLRSEDPFNRRGYINGNKKGFLSYLSTGEDEFPFKHNVTSEYLFIIKAYILLAEQMGLSDVIDALDKNLPVRDSIIYDLIIDLREINKAESPNDIHNKLLKIFKTPKKKAPPTE